MPRIGVKEEVKTRKKANAADEKKVKTKKIVETEKGKASQLKETKLQELKTPKRKTRETPKEKLVSKKNDIEKKAKSTTKKTASTKKSETKKVANKEVVVKKGVTTKKSAITKKTTKKATKSKKDDKKVKLEKIVKPKRKTVSKKTTTKKISEKTYLPEYYDLPYRYNDTIVKILYQTPKRIFVYWDVSDQDRQRYINAFGEDFFERTYPVLLVHNEELNYTFEVTINDFANSWYLDINDPKTKYVVQLGRKFKEIKKEQINYQVVEEEKINLQNDFIYIADSNKLEIPNDRILFEKVPKKIMFRNVKTGEIVEKETKQVLRKISKIYETPQVEDLYREFYGEETLNEGHYISNPSSGESLSSFFK